VTPTTTNHGRRWTTVDTTPEVRHATPLAAWPGSWLRDEEAVGACEEERAMGTTDRSALSGGDRPLRPELPSGRLCNLGNAAAIWVHGEQIAEPGGWTVREDDLRPVRRPAGIEACALPRRIEGQLSEPTSVGVDGCNVRGTLPVHLWEHLEHDLRPVRRPVRDLCLQRRIRQLDPVAPVDVHRDDPVPAVAGIPAGDDIPMEGDQRPVG